MLTILSFLLTILGSVNWLLIGLLQYDFVAGIFGYQASVFSRIVYIVIGASSIVLIIKLFKGKGSLNVLSRRNKKDLSKQIDKIMKKDEESAEEPSYSHAYNVEAGEEIDAPKREKGLFDEHFDDRG